MLQLIHQTKIPYNISRLVQPSATPQSSPHRDTKPRPYQLTSHRGPPPLAMIRKCHSSALGTWLQTRALCLDSVNRLSSDLTNLLLFFSLSSSFLSLLFFFPRAMKTEPPALNATDTIFPSFFSHPSLSVRISLSKGIIFFWKNVFLSPFLEGHALCFNSRIVNCSYKHE